MAKVFNPVGSLTTIKRYLTRNGIDGFHSIRELISFRENYVISRQQIISNQQAVTTNQRNALHDDIEQLENEIENNKRRVRAKLHSKLEQLARQYDSLAEAKKSFIQEFTYSFKALFTLIKFYFLKMSSEVIVVYSVRSEVKMLKKKRIRYQYLSLNFEDAVREDCEVALHIIDRKKRAVDEINTFIYGAIGEQKVVDELAQLSDEYTLINDFTYHFNKPIYSKLDKEYIKSIQIDHLLISPSGIFLIETKNWSKESVKNLNLRSPVKQIKRTNYALYKILSQNSIFKLDQHHWGDRRIPIRNLIVMINHRPNEEFQYVKVLTLQELLGYIAYFKPSLSNHETQQVSDYLLSVRQD